MGGCGQAPTLGAGKAPKPLESLSSEVKGKSFLNSGPVPVHKLNCGWLLAQWKPLLLRHWGISCALGCSRRVLGIALATAQALSPCTVGSRGTALQRCRPPAIKSRVFRQPPSFPGTRSEYLNPWAPLPYLLWGGDKWK